MSLHFVVYRTILSLQMEEDTMPFQSNPNKHPGYDPVAVSEIVSRTLSKHRQMLSLVHKHRKAKDAKAAAKVYKQIKELLVTL